MLAKNNRNDGDDNVNIDVVQGRSEVESEAKDQTKMSKKYALASDTLDNGEESEEKKVNFFNTKIIITENDDDYLIQSDNDQDTNNEKYEEKCLRIERTINILELGHSEENKREELESKELILSRKTQKEGDADDLVDTDTGTDTDMSETNKIYQAKHHDLHRTLHSLRIGHDDLSIDTAIDLKYNVTRNIHLSASTFVATEITENADDMTE